MNTPTYPVDFVNNNSILTPETMELLRTRIDDIMSRLPKEVSPVVRLALYDRATQMTDNLYAFKDLNVTQAWWVWLEQLDILATGLGGVRIGTLEK